MLSVNLNDNVVLLAQCLDTDFKNSVGRPLPQGPLKLGDKKDAGQGRFNPYPVASSATGITILSS